MYCSADDTFNVQHITRFLNAEQENFCLEDETVGKHIREYFKNCGKDLNDTVYFTAPDVSHFI